jgi:TonB family protein
MALPTADSTLALAERMVPPMDRRQRGFWLALFCALAFHGALLVGFKSVASRHAGARDGSDDAIAVEIVTEADLKSREIVQMPPSAPPPAASAPQPEPQPEAAAPAEPEPQPPQQVEKEAAPPETVAALPDSADLSPPQKQEKPAEKQSKPNEPAQKPVQKKPAAQARLDLSPPSTAPGASSSAGRSSNFSRPPGITRSGENDEFGRGVIRALRATMPAPRGELGRVTVRLFLNENGDLAEVQVVDSSGKPGFDQNIVFSTKQSNFPLPPLGSTVADRTFLITYIYR